MDKPRIREAIIVEGRYDKNTLSQIVDALIIETGGFRVFNRPEVRACIRGASERSGIIILTDSDASGFQIRSCIKSFVPEEKIKNAYIPDVYGKERRKKAPGREGKIGVEGMPPSVILEALLRAGATIEGTVTVGLPAQDPITVADLYRFGFTGKPDSRERRLRLLRHFSLPEHLGTQAMVKALSRISSRGELLALLESGEY